MNATDAALSGRAAAAELGTESDTVLSAQTSNKAAHAANRQHLPRAADEEVELPIGGALPRTAGAANSASNSGVPSGVGGVLPTARPGRDSVVAASAADTEEPVEAGVRGHNTSTDAVVAAAMANPKSSASSSARAAALNNAALVDEAADDLVGLSQTRPNTTAKARSGGQATAFGVEAQRLRQEEEEEQEEEYLRRQATPSNVSRQARPTSGSTAAGTAAGIAAGTAANTARVRQDDADLADSDLSSARVAELNDDYDRLVDPTPRTAQAQARGNTLSKTATAARGSSAGSRPVSGRYGQDDEESDLATQGSRSRTGESCCCVTCDNHRHLPSGTHDPRVLLLHHHLSAACLSSLMCKSASMQHTGFQHAAIQSLAVRPALRPCLAPSSPSLLA